MTPPAAEPKTKGEAAPRRSQGERSAETQQVINEATVRCLIADGYAGTTLSAVQQLSGVSRGAITHHFGSKHAMLISAIDHLAAGRELELSQAARDLPADTSRVRAVISLVWGTFKGDLFYAALELWTAARTDSRLRDELWLSERELGSRHRRLVSEMFGPTISSHEGYGRAFDTMFNLMRGAAMLRILRDEGDTEQQDIDEWTAIFMDMTTTGTQPQPVRESRVS